MDDTWPDEIPPEVAAAAQDEAIVAALAGIFQRNSRSEDGANRYLDPPEATTLARRVLAELLDPDGLQMAEVGGLRFYLELDTELYPGPNVIHANAWDGTQWRPVGRVPLPGGRPREG